MKFRPLLFVNWAPVSWVSETVSANINWIYEKQKCLKIKQIFYRKVQEHKFSSMHPCGDIFVLSIVPVKDFSIDFVLKIPCGAPRSLEFPDGVLLFSLFVLSPEGTGCEQRIIIVYGIWGINIICGFAVTSCVTGHDMTSQDSSQDSLLHFCDAVRIRRKYEPDLWLFVNLPVWRRHLLQLTTP